MTLTIIPSEGAVYENGLCYAPLIWAETPSNIHALQWQTLSGWLEFNDETPNEDITVLPQWANNAMDAWTAANTPIPPPLPVPPTAKQNKSTAVSLLTATDWTTIADVGNPQMANPYLVNQSEFIAYRNSIRQYAVYPIAGNINWAVLPLEVWKKV